MTERFARALRTLRLGLRRVDFFLARRFALATREDRVFFALIPAVGVVAGVVAILVQRASEGLRVLLWGFAPSFEFSVRELGLPGWRVVLALVVGGGLVALLQRIARAPLASQGVSALVESVALHGGRLSVRPVLYSAAAAVATVGSGGSLGREGPMLRLGAAISSWLGERSGLSSRRLKILLGCGTAAGFAAAYNVPIGGSLFAMEVVLGSFALEIFGPIVVASVMATLIARMAESSAPIYAAPGYELVSPAELLAYLGLGVVGAVAAVVFVLGVRVFSRLFRRLTLVPEGVRPVVGMAALAAVGIVMPEVLGNGFSTITAALHGSFAIEALLAIAALKLVATALTAGSGCPGGHFTPSLCFGALIGGAWGELVHFAFPNATATSGAYAAVGMAAVAAGSSHAPLSAILMLFEFTGNYQLILPLMLASIVSSVIAKRLYRYSIYTEPLERRGIELAWRMEEAALAGLRVDDLVRDDPDTLAPEAPRTQVVERFLGARRQRLFVVGSARDLLGCISLHDIKHTLREEAGAGAADARALMKPVPAVVKGADRLHRAAEVFAKSDFERLPVLDDEGRFRGVVAKRDLLAVYAQEVLGRPAVLSTYVASDQPGAKGTAVELPPDFALRSVAVPETLVGLTLAEAALPQKLGVRVLEVRRPAAEGWEWIAADAATVLGGSDDLVVLGPTAAIEALVAGRLEAQPGAPPMGRVRTPPEPPAAGAPKP